MNAAFVSIARFLGRIGILPHATVGQFDSASPPSAQAVMDAGRLAERTYSLLDQSGDELVLLARAGQNMAQYGLTYSHLGFALRESPLHEWHVRHLLNVADDRTSSIFEEGLVNFYSDSPYRYAAGILSFPKPLQLRIKELLLSGNASRLHCPVYSLTSYTWSETTQNSNQWVLEVIASALAGFEQPDRAHVQAWLRQSGFEGIQLPINLFVQWVAPLVRGCVNVEDQPAHLRQRRRIETVPVEAVFKFLTSEHSPVRAFGGPAHLQELGI